MIIYKDILAKLNSAGYNTTRLRREKLLPESTITEDDEISPDELQSMIEEVLR